MFQHAVSATAISVLAAGLNAAPSQATALTSGQVLAALHAIRAKTVTAEAGGYQLRIAVESGTATLPQSHGTVDPLHRASYLHDGIDQYWKAGLGTWVRMSTATSTANRAALLLLGRAGAVYIFAPAPALSPAAVFSTVPSGREPLDITLGERTIVSGTQTSNADGTTTYVVTDYESDLTPAAASDEIFTVDADGSLVGYREAFGGSLYAEYWIHGPQAIVTPVSAQSVGNVLLARARAAITALPVTVHTHAVQVVARAKALAKAAHRQAVTAADVKKAATLIAAAHKSDLLKVGTSALPRGVKVYAKNPATQKVTAYTVIGVRGRAVIKTA